MDVEVKKKGGVCTYIFREIFTIYNLLGAKVTVMVEFFPLITLQGLLQQSETTTLEIFIPVEPQSFQGVLHCGCANVHTQLVTKKRQRSFTVMVQLWYAAC